MDVFTNLDDNIFIVNNQLPNEEWVMLQAKYSRCPKSRNLRQEYLDSHNSSSTSREFIEKWVLKFHHDSISEAANIRLCFEGISIIASKVIEDARLASFVERSTRYAQFGDFVIPSFTRIQNIEPHGLEPHGLEPHGLEPHGLEPHGLEPINIFKSNCLKCFELYSSFLEKGIEKDDARYLLPCATKTNFSMTVNTRELIHCLEKWSHHPLEEIREISNKIVKESKKVIPTLIEQINNLPNIVPQRIDWKNSDGENHLGENQIRLIHISHPSPGYFLSQLIGRSTNEEDSCVIIKKYLTSEGGSWRILENVSLTFEIIIDYGAYRDLQRHRFTTRIESILNINYGYEVPSILFREDKEEERKLYVNLMNHIKQDYILLHQEFKIPAEQLQYMLPLSFRKRFIWTMNLREFIYIVRLRTTKGCHYSYRNLVLKMKDIVDIKIPWIKNFY